MKTILISGALTLAALMAAPAVAHAQTRAEEPAVADREVRVWRIWAHDRERVHRSWEREQHRDFGAWRESQRSQVRAFHEQERTGDRQDDDLDGYFIDDPNRYNAAPPPRSSVDR